MNKKRIATSVAAVATAAALLLGGTFAWQSISQTAINEASDIVNPGGRLHDDFDGSNKDVYVENFADEPIFARVRLDEYFEITINKGMGEGIEHTVEVIGSKTEKDGEVKYNYKIFKDYESDGEFDAANERDAEENVVKSWWKWTTGGSTAYMPTFNMNKDSLQADVNGTYEGPDKTVTDDEDDDRYTDYVEYKAGDTLTAAEVYDADSNNIDEGKDAVENTNIKTISDVKHTAKMTGDATLMSMQEWIDAGSNQGPYWVYDKDGWVYWAQPIPGRNADGTTNATGLLLSGIELQGVMDDSWYYAINVVGQFITADDMGSYDEATGVGTGFYDSEKGAPPSDNAKALLKAIGVDVSGENGGGETGGGEETLDVSVDEAASGVMLHIAKEMVSGSSYTLNIDDPQGVFTKPVTYQLIDTDNTGSTLVGDVITAGKIGKIQLKVTDANGETSTLGGVVSIVPANADQLETIPVSVSRTATGEMDQFDQPVYTYTATTTVENVVAGKAYRVTFSGVDDALDGIYLDGFFAEGDVASVVSDLKTYVSVDSDATGNIELHLTNYTVDSEREDGKNVTVAVVTLPVVSDTTTGGGTTEAENYTAKLYSVISYYDEYYGGDVVYCNEESIVKTGKTYYFSLNTLDGEAIDVSSAQLKSTGYSMTIEEKTVDTGDREYSFQGYFVANDTAERGRKGITIEADGKSYKFDVVFASEVDFAFQLQNVEWYFNGDSVYALERYDFASVEAGYAYPDYVEKISISYDGGEAVDIEDVEKPYRIEAGHKKMTVNWTIKGTTGSSEFTIIDPLLVIDYPENVGDPVEGWRFQQFSMEYGKSYVFNITSDYEVKWDNSGFSLRDGGMYDYDQYAVVKFESLGDGKYTYTITPKENTNEYPWSYYLRFGVDDYWSHTIEFLILESSTT